MNLDQDNVSDKAPSKTLLYTTLGLAVVGVGGAAYNFFTRPSKKALQAKIDEVTKATEALKASHGVSSDAINAQVSSQIAASERRTAEMIVSFEKRIGERFDKLNEAIIPSLQEAMEAGMHAANKATVS